MAVALRGVTAIEALTSLVISEAGFVRLWNVRNLYVKYEACHKESGVEKHIFDRMGIVSSPGEM